MMLGRFVIYLLRLDYSLLKRELLLLCFFTLNAVKADHWWISMVIRFELKDCIDVYSL